MNKSSIDRGLFRSMVLKKYEDISKKNTQTTNEDEFGIKDKSLVKGINEKEKNYDKITDKGFAPEETKIINGDIIIAKVTPITDGDGKLYRDESQSYKSNVAGHVDKVWSKLYDGDGYKMIKMRIRSERTPMVGDKFCVTGDHDVLIENNEWISITELNMTHKMATLNENGQVEYHNPFEVIILDYQGVMYEIITNDIDTTVTSHHWMATYDNENKKINFVKIDEIYENKIDCIMINSINGIKDDNCLININHNHIKKNIVENQIKVYCCKVPEPGIFCVRRNGKVHWTGNCSRHGKTFLPKSLLITNDVGLLLGSQVNLITIMTKHAWGRLW